MALTTSSIKQKQRAANVRERRCETREPENQDDIRNRSRKHKFHMSRYQRRQHENAFLARVARKLGEAAYRLCLLSFDIRWRDNIPNGEALARELHHLQRIDPSTWPEASKRHYTFVKEVLEAVHEGRRPKHIRKPDGEYFVWPNTFVEEHGGNDSEDPIDPPIEFGVLRARGYRVGRMAGQRSDRWTVLARIYEEPFDDLALPADYLDEWGRPGTAKRLQKLANTIASLSRNMKRKIRRGGSRMNELAVDHWESDLAHIKRVYYDGKCEPYFSWPQIPAQH